MAQEVLAQLEQVVAEHQDVLERRDRREGAPCNHLVISLQAVPCSPHVVRCFCRVLLPWLQSALSLGCTADDSNP